MTTDDRAYSTLPQRMRDAADTLEEYAAYVGYTHTDYAMFNARGLRNEAEHVESEIPQ